MKTLIIILLVAIAVVFLFGDSISSSNPSERAEGAVNFVCLFVAAVFVLPLIFHPEKFIEAITPGGWGCGGCLFLFILLLVIGLIANGGQIF